MAPVDAPQKSPGDESARTQRNVSHFVALLQRSGWHFVLDILISSADSGGWRKPLPFRNERMPHADRRNIAVVEGAEGLLDRELDVEARSQREISISCDKILAVVHAVAGAQLPAARGEFRIRRYRRRFAGFQQRAGEVLPAHPAFIAMRRAHLEPVGAAVEHGDQLVAL